MDQVFTRKARSSLTYWHGGNPFFWGGKPCKSFPFNPDKLNLYQKPRETPKHTILGLQRRLRCYLRLTVNMEFSARAVHPKQMGWNRSESPPPKKIAPKNKPTTIPNWLFNLSRRRSEGCWRPFPSFSKHLFSLIRRIYHPSGEHRLPGKEKVFPSLHYFRNFIYFSLFIADGRLQTSIILFKLQL